MNTKGILSKLVNLIAIMVFGLLAMISPAIASAQNFDWVYRGSNDFIEWGKLSPKFATCELGSNQSPIDIQDSEIEEIAESFSANLQFNYHVVPLEVIDNGHNIQVNYPPGSFINLGGKTYKLLQFHFHTPSEHKFDGHGYPMEVHLVHQDSSGEYLVIAVMIATGAENLLLKTIEEHLPQQGVHTQGEQVINVSSFLNSNPTYYSYQGSLTTPPCTENVHWLVMPKPIEASPQQIKQFNSLHNLNARSIKPLNGRFVQLIHQQS